MVELYAAASDAIIRPKRPCGRYTSIAE